MPFMHKTISVIKYIGEDWPKQSLHTVDHLGAFIC